MAQYLCRTVTELPAYMQANFIVPEGAEMYAGDIYVPKILHEDLHGNWTVYNADAIEDVSKEIPAIVINNSFETLADGRRPDGQPDYTAYAYEEGEVVTAIKLLPEIKLELSFDTIQNKGDIEVNGYLIPENGINLLRFVSTIDDVNSKIYLKIEALKHFRCGGAMGMGFIDTMVVRVKYMPAEIAPALYSAGDILTAKLSENPTEYVNMFLQLKEQGIDNSEMHIIGNSFEHLGCDTYDNIYTMCCFGYARGENYSLGNNGDVIYFYCNQAMIDVFGENTLPNITDNWFTGDGWYKYYDAATHSGESDYKVEKQAGAPNVNFSLYKFDLAGTMSNEIDTGTFNDAFKDMFETKAIQKSPLDTLVVSAGTIESGSGQIPSGRTVATLEKVDPEITYAIDFIDGDNDNQYFEINSQSKLIVAKDNVPANSSATAKYFNIQVKVTDTTSGIESPNNVTVGEAQSIA